MRKIFILFAFILPLFIFSCTKEEEGYGYKSYYGSFSAELLSLPGATTLDVYVDGSKIDSLEAGGMIGNAVPRRLTAGKATTISFKKAGTDLLVVDTTITIGAGEKAALKIAYSSILGVQSFTSGSDANVAADSCAFFLFNQLPDDIQPESVKVDAYLFKGDAVTEPDNFENTGIMWSNLEKNKLHSAIATVRLTEGDGSTNAYIIRLKDAATGEFLKDAYDNNYLYVNLVAGQRGILTLTAYKARNKWKFSTDYAIY